MDEVSISYSDLVIRINQIIEHFNYVSDDPLSPPTGKEEDMIRAMIVLSHAEFEAYIENLAKNLIETAENKWKSDKIANKNLAALFINSDKLVNDDEHREMTYLTFSYKKIIEYKEWLKARNHGIKSKNIQNIYCPLGYDLDDFDAAFLNELDSFGSDRGRIAHSSFSQTQSILDYPTEKEKILRILAELKEFEEKL